MAWVSPSPSLCHVWVVLAIFALHVASWSPSLRCVGVTVAIFALCGCRGHGRRAMWCCGRGGCHHAA